MSLKLKQNSGGVCGVANGGLTSVQEIVKRWQIVKERACDSSRQLTAHKTGFTLFNHVNPSNTHKAIHQTNLSGWSALCWLDLFPHYISVKSDPVVR